MENFVPTLAAVTEMRECECTECGWMNRRRAVHLCVDEEDEGPVWAADLEAQRLPRRAVEHRLVLQLHHLHKT